MKSAPSLTTFAQKGNGLGIRNASGFSEAGAVLHCMALLDYKAWRFELERGFWNEKTIERTYL